MSPWWPLKHQIVSIFTFFDRHFVRPAPQFQRFLLKNDFLTKEVTPLDPSHKIRIKILHKMTCLPAPHHFSWIRSWQKRCFCSKPFYLNFVMIFQPPLLLQFSKTHYHEMSWALRYQPCMCIFLSGLPWAGLVQRGRFLFKEFWTRTVLAGYLSSRVDNVLCSGSEVQ